MKRMVSVFVLVAMMLSTAVTASARWDGGFRCSPALGFSGTTATCAATVVADESNARISATMTLYRIHANGKRTTAATWSNLTGTGRLDVSRTVKVVSGTKYQLVISGTVTDSNGSHTISAVKTATCP